MDPCETNAAAILGVETVFSILTLNFLFSKYMILLV